MQAVLNNARQLSAASDQYFLENGVSTVARTNLVGSSNYVKSLNSRRERDLSYQLHSRHHHHD